MIKITTIDDISFELEAFGRTVICPKGFRMLVINNDLEIINKDEKEDVLVPNTDYSEFEVDGVTFNNIVDLQLALYPILFSSASGSGADSARAGSADYEDTTTPTTPISILGGLLFYPLTNDALGVNTTEAFLPSGVSSLWDATTNAFNFTSLGLGDIVGIRLDCTPITVSNNTDININLDLGIGDALAWSLPFVSSVNRKTASNKRIVVYNEFVVRNDVTRLNPARFMINLEKTGTVIVRGWYVKIIKRG